MDFNETPTAGPYLTAAWQALRDGGVVERGDLHLLPDSVSEISESALGAMRLDLRWADHIAGQDMTLGLSATFPGPEVLRDCPVVFPSEIAYALHATYPVKPLPNRASAGVVESIVLLPRLVPPNTTAPEQVDTVSDDGVTLSAPYGWAPWEPAPSLETRSIHPGESTTLTGLTTAPIVLTDPWSRTVFPSRHNWSHYHVLEPGAAPDLPASTVSELFAMDIRYIVIERGIGPGRIDYVGFDGSTRPTP